MKPLYTWSTSTRMVDVMPVSDEGIRKLEEFVKEEKRKQRRVRSGRDDKAGACSACVYLSDRMEKIWKDDKLHLCGKKKYTKRVTS